MSDFLVGGQRSGIIPAPAIGRGMRGVYDGKG